jgi:hypothetical protein
VLRRFLPKPVCGDSWKHLLIKNSHLKLLLFLISMSFAPPVQVAVFNQQEFRSSSSSGCF